MNRQEKEHYRSALFNLGDNCSILGKIARPPPAPAQTPPPPQPHHTQTYTPHRHTPTHLTPSHPIII